jgi:hypothetical protein
MRESYNETEVHPDHLEMAAIHPDDGLGMERQRSARNDPEMRDGNNSHGSPGFESGQEEFTTDNDVGDSAAVPEELEEEEAGIVEGVPANQEDRLPDAEPPAHAGLGDTAHVNEEIKDRGTVATTAGGSMPAAINTAGSGPPIDNYQRLTVKQILARVADLPTDEVRRVRDYEQSHRRRKTLLVQLERRLQRHEDYGSRRHEHPGHRNA